MSSQVDTLHMNILMFATAVKTHLAQKLCLQTARLSAKRGTYFFPEHSNEKYHENTLYEFNSIPPMLTFEIRTVKCC